MKAPPPPPPQDGAPGPWQAPKPTSGNAIASLVCGLGSFLFCPLAALPGLVLGMIGIAETGREGVRTGRGLAIAGTVISGLAIVGAVVAIGAMVAIAGYAEHRQRTEYERAIEHDSELILDRLRDYARANGNSLGPGGPILADWSDPYDVNPGPDEQPLIVEGALHLDYLVADHELGEDGYPLLNWELQVTGTRTATLRARGWGEEIHAEFNVLDAAKRRYVRRNS